jgi:small GTP-binding protein
MNTLIPKEDVKFRGTKITFIGMFSTGKTSIARRMKFGKFDSDSEATIGASFIMLEHKKIRYDIWDTAGQERYLALLPMYFRGARIIIFVFDVSKISSLYDIKKFINNFSSLENYKIIVIGNKIDLIKQNELDLIKDVTKHHFNSLDIGAYVDSYIFLSTKKGDNFDEFMDQLNQTTLKLPDIGSVIINNVEDNILDINNEQIIDDKCSC